MPTYAIVNDRGNQFRVQEGDRVLIDRLDSEAGKPIEFKEVLLYANGEDIRIGNPNLPNVKVVGESEGDEKGPKVRTIKYRRREMYRRHWGHRQKYTVVRIKKLEIGG